MNLQYQRVAMEESSRVGARCFYIDQDINVTLQQFSKVSSFYWLGFIISDRDKVEYARSSVQEIQNTSKKLRPDLFKVMVEDRDKFMFTNLRSFQGKVVAVVGMGHMDGIELLWRRVEEDDNSSVFITVIEGCHGAFLVISFFFAFCLFEEYPVCRAKKDIIPKLVSRQKNTESILNTRMVKKKMIDSGFSISEICKGEQNHVFLHLQLLT
ncbi:uncharacterized protein LOC113288343 isoform X2 [Papaver somniferum]|uniref:uncharacterized protein LOC113288343 isoform X2 n=1 Tax=Papaver somniferum TaxID=3469 RepID=UPI000E6FBE6B|nr:uncharacterized protein LOC113288343 isoform X2 [Papaver somniferum]